MPFPILLFPVGALFSAARSRVVSNRAFSRKEFLGGARGPRPKSLFDCDLTQPGGGLPSAAPSGKRRIGAVRRPADQAGAVRQHNANRVCTCQRQGRGWGELQGRLQYQGRAPWRLCVAVSAACSGRCVPGGALRGWSSGQHTGLLHFSCPRHFAVARWALVGGRCRHGAGPSSALAGRHRPASPGATLWDAASGPAAQSAQVTHCASERPRCTAGGRG